MNKYLQTLKKNVKKQLEEWLNGQGCIQYKELYRFLHSISGTAMTIGFNQAGEVAQSLISQLERTMKKKNGQRKIYKNFYIH